MLSFIEYIKDRLEGKAPKGAKRSPYWNRVRKGYLRKNARCAVCGCTSKLQVHHIIPFHLDPKYELNEDNLVTLCTNKKYGINCHLLIGHLGNFKKYNTAIKIDVFTWNQKLNPSKK